jgi:hypothetical protein
MRTPREREVLCLWSLPLLPEADTGQVRMRRQPMLPRAYPSAMPAEFF